MRSPKLYAILRKPDGTLVKVPVKKDSSTVRKYDAYVKSVQGIYVPKSIARHLYQPKAT